MPDKKWVFDTVVMSNFLIAEAAGPLMKTYRRNIVITSQVYDELAGGFRTYSALSNIEDMINRNQVKPVSLGREERTLYSKLIRQLGKGEASCIAVAKHRNFIVVTDDRCARNQCVIYNAPFTGTIGILKKACLKKIISPEQGDVYLKQMADSGFFSPVNSISGLL